ncbi:unnamed protein product [Pleuronectes platessa]|uniref:Uncharacterized protein n=1 Tax=Pleuronectes platessa TaxID=8262 RepID=A0A9N7TN32_PLEPL|nr:unnamed protein product [Pleuronectes platessa]
MWRRTDPCVKAHSRFHRCSLLVAMTHRWQPISRLSSAPQGRGRGSSASQSRCIKGEVASQPTRDLFPSHQRHQWREYSHRLGSGMCHSTLQLLGFKADQFQTTHDVNGSPFSSLETRSPRRTRRDQLLLLLGCMVERLHDKDMLVPGRKKAGDLAIADLPWATGPPLTAEGLLV